MIYTKLTQAYLSGEKFSNAALVKLKNTQIKTIYRDEYLLDISKNKRILHIGFVDHLPLIDEKINNGKWLHKKLMENCEVCCGVDINEDGVKCLQDIYGYQDLYAFDVIKDDIPEALINIHFDYILIPDVIEHIGNPVEFLSEIREKFGKNIDKMILTTPNAFRLNNVFNTFKNTEIINSDHRFWFTPYTLSKVFFDAGFKVDSLNYLEHGKIGMKRFFRRFFLSKYHSFRDTLIIEASLK